MQMGYHRRGVRTRMALQKTQLTTAQMRARDMEPPTGHWQPTAAQHDCGEHRNGRDQRADARREQASDRHPEHRAERIKGLQPTDALAPLILGRELDHEETGDSIRGAGAETNE